MNPNKLIIVFLVFQNVINEVQSQQNTSQTNLSESKQPRILASQLQPLRVTVDYSQFDQYFVSQSDRDYIRKIFGFFQSFASSLISVVPRTSNIANNGLIWCGLTFIGAQNAIFGYSNTDFQIVVSATNSIFANYKVLYNVCNWDQNRPILMEVRYQMNKFSQTTVANHLNQLKRAFLQEGLWDKGQLSHWRNPFTALDGDLQNRQYYNVNTDLYVSQSGTGGTTNYYLKGPNLQQLVRKHFNCPTAIGLQVLDQKNLANFLPNDLFSTYADQAGDNLDNFVFSQFDAAILKDMGNYEQINDNIVDKILWGSNMGCPFLDNSCNNLITSSIKQDGNLYQCSQFSTGKFQQSESVVQNQINSGQCPQITDSNIISCLNVNNNSQASQFGETYGSFSKCFQSNIFSKISAAPTINPPIRCLYTQCDQSKEYITISLPSGEYFLCKEPYQVLYINTDSYQGTINCPSNFSKFCQGASCPNNCNQNGYCQSGECICQYGFSGDDCSIQCPLNNCSCQAPCVQCRSSSTQCTSCLAGYQLIVEKGTCKKQCDNSCLECELPLNDKSCTSCKEGFYLFQNQCFQCLSPCQTCTQQRDKCLSCVDGYKLNETKNICSPICYGTCKECILPSLQNSCKSCFSQYYLTQQGECLPCSEQCLNCQGGAENCNQCYPGYILDPFTFKCNPICAQNCLTCTQPLSQFLCTSCDKNYYLKNNQCLSCLQITDFSQPIPKECDGLFLFDSDCNSRCKVCLTQDINFCQSCQDQTTNGPYCDCPLNSIFLNGLCRFCPSQQFFDLSSSSCLQCHPSCQSCFGTKSNQCYTCFVQNAMNFISSSNSCICKDQDSMIVITRQLNQEETAVCKRGMDINFTRFYPNYQSQYQMFQATFTMNLSQNTQSASILQSFSFYIPEIQQTSYEIQIETVQNNYILFQIIPKKSFHANYLIVTIKNTYLIQSTDGISMKPSLLNKSFTLQIGPVFIDDSGGSGQNSGGINDKLNSIAGFINYNKQVTESINFLNQFSIFLHLINTIQPSALFITINTNLPPIFYTLQRVMGTFVYQNVPEQSVYRVDPKDCKQSYLTIDYCDLENQNPQPYNQFQRLGFSIGFFLNVQNFFNQSIIGGCIFLLTKYLLQFYNEDLSNQKDLTKQQQLNLKIEEIKENPSFQQQNQIQQLRRTGGVPFGYSNIKFFLVIQFLYLKSFDYFYSTFEANLLLFSMSAHLFMRVNIFDLETQQNPLIRISTYILVLCLIFLAFLLSKAYNQINRLSNFDDITENLSNQLKMESGYFCRNFHLLNFLKKWLICCLHIELYYYPKVLIIVVISIYCFGAFLEIIFRPFKKTYQNMVRIIGDLIFAFVYFCTLKTHQIYLSLQLQTELDNSEIQEFNLWGLIASYSLISYNGLYLVLYLVSISDILFSELCKKFFNQYREIKITFRKKENKESKKLEQLEKNIVSSLAHKETIENNNAAFFDLNCSIYSQSQFNEQYIYKKSDRSKKLNQRINTKKTLNNNQKNKKSQKISKIKIKIDKYGNIYNSNLEKFMIPVESLDDDLNNDQL